jgi:hypothetical protein
MTSHVGWSNAFFVGVGSTQMGYHRPQIPVGRATTDTVTFVSHAAKTDTRRTPHANVKCLYLVLV